MGSRKKELCLRKWEAGNRKQEIGTLPEEMGKQEIGTPPEEMGSIRNGISDAGLLFWKNCAGVIFQIYFISSVAGD